MADYNQKLAHNFINKQLNEIENATGDQKIWKENKVVGMTHFQRSIVI